jgi:hypothetical protein
MSDKKARIQVVATAGPGSGNNAKYSFEFSEWKPVDQSTLIRFIRGFSADVTDNELFEALQELQQVLASMFLSDSVSRKVYYFEQNGELDDELRIKFWRVFGHPKNFDERDVDYTTQSFSRIGLKHETPLRDVDYVPNEKVVSDWYLFLEKHARISSSVQLLQEAFGHSHLLYSKNRIVRLPELATVILLLVSGLESLFRYGEESNADISFKFRTVGAAFYKTYVNSEILSKSFGRDTRKLTFSEFKSVLKFLYDLRSQIAHGDMQREFFGNKNLKKMNKLFKLLSVGEVKPEMKTILFAHLILAVQQLEPHILAIVRLAKDDLTKGVKILDEIL